MIDSTSWYTKPSVCMTSEPQRQRPPAGNRLARMVAWCQRLPRAWQPFLLSRLFNSVVKFAGTAGIRITQASAQRVVVQLRNRRRVQNHIKGVHAAAMALLGETASGLVFGLSVPDDKIPLLKSMHVDYLRRAEGNLCAEASLSAEQVATIGRADKGELEVTVVITDDAGEQPLTARYVWAWVPKKC